VLILAVLCASAAKYGQSVLMNGVSRRVVRDVRSHLFKHLMGLSVRFHQKNHSAQLVSRITGDLEIFGRFLTEALVRFIQDFLDFAGMLFFITLNGGVFIFVIAGVIGRRHRAGERHRAQAPQGRPPQPGRHGRDRDRHHRGAHRPARGEGVRVGGPRVRPLPPRARSAMKIQMTQRRLRSLTEPVVMGIGAIGIACIMIVGGRRVLSGGMGPTAFIMNVPRARAARMAGPARHEQAAERLPARLAAADRVGTVLQAKSEV
jgi:ABC-type bacteriocin/lantibiotic exporter with double-glycine peptidase domain